MNIVHGLVLAALETLCVPGAFAEGFSFGDLSLNTTAQELRHRYPTSKMVGRYMYVSPAESHDHIFGIQIPDKAGTGRLKLFFEYSNPSDPGRDPEYPKCDRIVSMIEARYGSPDASEEFSEERARNRRLSWKRSGEVLVLVCFRLPGTEFRAEALTIDLVAQ